MNVVYQGEEMIMSNKVVEDVVEEDVSLVFNYKILDVDRFKAL